MKLGTRVSAFFLAALAVILVGNSVLVFAVARSYLHRRFDEQLRSSLNTLIAAVEVEDDDVKWDLSQHTVTVGAADRLEHVGWIVFNEDGDVIDRSRDFDVTIHDAVAGAMSRIRSGDEASPLGWRILHRVLAAPHPKPTKERDPLEHAELTVVVAGDLSSLDATLRWLAGTLTLLPAVCWIASALAGKWFCRHAIAPVSEMAKDVRGIRADDTLARLRVPASGDELEELGNAFNELLDQLFVGYERQRRFASDAAHQLRTPLTVMMGQVEVALRRRRDTEQYEATLGILHQEVTSLRQTVEALLFLARTRDEERLPDLETFNLDIWLGEYAVRWTSDARGDDLRLRAEPRLACRASPGLLAQLLDVLVSNAFKYSQSGSLVEVRAARREASVVLEVADKGIGIASDDLNAIFEPFFRGRQARQSGSPGTGLGLAIARRISAALGGHLRCESQLGVGTRFTLTLPGPPAATVTSESPAGSSRDSDGPERPEGGTR